ncbi:hypothetical protein HJG60_010497 [Phyllostomus discolor]|uniref:Uncharacterized protein n=1 Tax=Phyllostomus discolor TaxID=89673 RepID=A0A834AGY6_9CHIR|nr:hypothetical protein HJG60_010497 [Phyllostomus discolor]
MTTPLVLLELLSLSRFFPELLWLAEKFVLWCSQHCQEAGRDVTLEGFFWSSVLILNSNSLFIWVRGDRVSSCRSLGKAAGHSPETSEGLGEDTDLWVSVKLTPEMAFWFPSLSYFGGQVQIRDLCPFPSMAGLNPVLPFSVSINNSLGKFPNCEVRTVSFLRVTARICKVTSLMQCLTQLGQSF